MNPDAPHPDQHHLDHADRLVDANLRALASRVRDDLPADLAPEQIAAFKSPHADARQHARHEPIVHPQGAFSMPRSRLLFGLSSAAAAVILAVGVLLFVGDQRQQVNAATILNALKARPISGVRMVVTDARQDGVRLDGEFILHFRTPRTMDQLIEQADHADAADDTDVLLNATITVDEGSMQGFALDVRAAFSPQAKWIFARSSDTPFPSDPNDNAPAGPDAMALMLARNLLRQGIFVDLNQFNLDDVLGRLEPDITEPDITKTDLPEDLRAAIEADLGVPPEQAPRSGFNTHGNVRVRATRPGADPDTGERTPGTISLGLELGRAEGGADAFAQFLTQMLTGRAGPAQFDQFRQMVEQAGGSATVEAMGNDRFLLTAMPDQARAGCFTALQITYARDAGVEQIEMLGRGEGSAVLTFLNDPINPARLDPEPLLSPNTFIVTPELLNMLLPRSAARPPAAPTPSEDAEQADSPADPNETGGE